MTSQSGKVSTMLLTALIAVTLISGDTAVTAAASAPTGTDWFDRSFGQGPVILDPSSGLDTAREVVIQPDGKVLVIGTVDEGTPRSRIIVLRFLAKGDPDAAFGTVGKVVLDAGRPESAAGLALQSDGKIVVAGCWCPEVGFPEGVVAARLDSNGRLDSSFGGGTPSYTVKYPETVRSVADVALTVNGKILIAGTAGNGNASGPMLLRLNPDGAADETFGSGGFTGVGRRFGDFFDAQGVSAMLVQPDGKILVGGTWSVADFGYPGATTKWFTISRYFTDGRLDESFGDQGTVRTDLSRGTERRNSNLNGMALQPNGRIVATGWASGRNTEVAVVRYLPDGKLDPAFGAAGLVVTAAPTASVIGMEWTGAASGATVAVDGLGRILVGGMAMGAGTGDLALVRYTPTGALDLTFARAGWMRADVRGSHDAISTLAIQGDGRPVVAGVTDNTGSTSALVVARFPAVAGSTAVTAWGWNGLGQLGDGTTAPQSLPVSVPGPSGVNVASAGRLHSLSVEGDGTLWAWGWNGLGQLGNGTTVDAHRPIQVALQNVTAAAAGAYHSLAVSGGRVYAWGWNAGGQIGDGTVIERHAPVLVPGLTDVVSVAAGIYHSLALRIDGTVWAWGWNGLGAVGDGTTTDRLTPVQVPGLAGATAIAAGALHSLAVAAQRPEWASYGVWAWGYNAFRQANSFSDAQTTLSPWFGRTGRPSAIVAGGFHNVLLVDDGRVLVWGWNGVGQVGNGTTMDRQGPVGFVALTNATSVSAGLAHTIATDVAGRTWAMGWNGWGQLGDGTRIDRHTPVEVNSGRASAPAAGWYHSLSVASSP